MIGSYFPILIQCLIEFEIARNFLSRYVNPYRNGILTLITVITDIGITQNSGFLAELTYLLTERIALLESFFFSLFHGFQEQVGTENSLDHQPQAGKN